MDKINDIEKCMTPGGNVKEIEINSKCRHLIRIITKDYQKKQILDRCANCNHRNGIWTPSSVSRMRITLQINDVASGGIIMPKWKCKNWSEETAIEHDLEPCDCISGCGGKLCGACCEEEMFGSEEDE